MEDGRKAREEEAREDEAPEDEAPEDEIDLPPPEDEVEEDTEAKTMEAIEDMDQDGTTFIGQVPEEQKDMKEDETLPKQGANHETGDSTIGNSQDPPSGTTITETSPDPHTGTRALEDGDEVEAEAEAVAADPAVAAEAMEPRTHQPLVSEPTGSLGAAGMVTIAPQHQAVQHVFVATEATERRNVAHTPSLLQVHASLVIRASIPLPSVEIQVSD